MFSISATRHVVYIKYNLVIDYTSQISIVLPKVTLNITSLIPLFSFIIELRSRFFFHARNKASTGHRTAFNSELYQNKFPYRVVV